MKPPRVLTVGLFPLAQSQIVALAAAGTEPVYRRLTDGTDGTQGGNDEADQAAPNARKKKK